MPPSICLPSKTVAGTHVTPNETQSEILFVNRKEVRLALFLGFKAVQKVHFQVGEVSVCVLFGTSVWVCHRLYCSHLLYIQVGVSVNSSVDEWMQWF